MIVSKRLSSYINEYHARLYNAMQSGDLRAFMREYKTLQYNSLIFRVSSRMFETFVPITYMCREGLAWERATEKFGYAQAARKMLERWDLDIRYALGSHTLQVLESEAFLSYGNHTSGFEHFPFDALFQREDVYHVAASFIGKLGPALGKRLIYVQNTVERTSAKNWQEKIADMIGDFVWPTTTDRSHMRSNLEALKLAANKIAKEGGGVNVFPTGSVKPSAEWQSGLGWIVKQILSQPQTRKIYIVPIVYGLSPIHILASEFLPSLHLIKLLAQVETRLFEPSPYVFVPRAIALEDLGVSRSDTANEITLRLKDIWREVYQTATKKFTKWPRIH